MALWLGAVLAGTGIAGLRGRLPGVEPRPYIIRFTEDRPNPLYRRVCYTLAWSEVIAFALLNIAGLVMAIVDWHLADASALRRRVFPDRRHRLAARRVRSTAAREGVDAERRTRASVLLRISLGRLHRAAGAVDPVESCFRDRRPPTCSS